MASDSSIRRFVVALQQRDRPCEPGERRPRAVGGGTTRKEVMPEARARYSARCLAVGNEAVAAWIEPRADRPLGEGHLPRCQHPEAPGVEVNP
jgi:hypothetical protein